MTVKDLVNQMGQRLKAIAGDRAYFEAKLLVARGLSCRPEALILHDDRPIASKEMAAVESLVARRLKHEPVAYLLESKEFYGFNFLLNDSVLIPRPESEELIEAAKEFVALHKPVAPIEARPSESHRSESLRLEPPRLGPSAPLRVLDLGTGSGCLALTLAKLYPIIEVWALDKSRAALEVAYRNRKNLNLSEDRVHLIEGDIIKGPSLLDFARQSTSQAPLFFDLIISNPPYIPTADLKSLVDDIKDFEPMSALDGGEGGLIFYRAILEYWFPLLSDDGALILETYSEKQRQDIQSLQLLRPCKDLRWIERGCVLMAMKSL